MEGGLPLDSGGSPSGAQKSLDTQQTTSFFLVHLGPRTLEMLRSAQFRSFSQSVLATVDREWRAMCN
jgi:hypothetical protein